MLKIDHLLEIADAYKAAADVGADKTLSHQVFGDSKKLGQLRRGAGITVDRFNAAAQWFSKNWPEEAPAPPVLKAMCEDISCSQSRLRHE